jgi:hypothetical protein
MISDFVKIIIMVTTIETIQEEKLEIGTLTTEISSLLDGLIAGLTFSNN